MTKTSYHHAIVFALLATFFGAAINAMVKSLGNIMDPLTYIFFRAAFALPLIWFYLQSRGELPKINAETMSRHAPRSIIGIASYFCLIYIVQHIPLANATAVSLSQPFFVAFLAPLLLKEKLPPLRILLVLVGFLGVCLILKPDGQIPPLVMTIAILHPLFYALAAIQIRFLSQTESAKDIMFFYMFFCTIFSAPWALLHFPTLNLHQWFWLFLIALVGTAFQFCQNKSLELAEASSITPFNYVALIWTVLFAVIFWQEWPDAWSWAGMGLIISMGLMLNFMAKPKVFAL